MKIHGLGIALAVGVLLAAARIFCGCSGPGALTPADQQSVTRDGVEIAVCQDEGRRCKADAGSNAAALCWPVYDKCIQSAGLRDGGVK